MVDTSYATLEQLKNSITLDEDSVHDDFLDLCLDAASRSIDDFTNRRFYLDDAVAARVYRTSDRLARLCEGDLLMTDEIGNATGVVVQTWNGVAYATVNAGDYELYPESDISLGRPATGVLLPGGGWSAYRKIKVTARWGWPAVPAVVRQACLLQATRLFYRKSSPSGMMGDPQWGVMRIPFMDPDVKALLLPLQVLLVA